MKSPKLFSIHPSKNALGAVLFSLCMGCANVIVSADETPKSAAKPVARLLSTSRQEAPVRARARLISGARVVTGVAVSRLVAPVAPADGKEKHLFDLINDERRARGHKPLAWDGELTRIARYHSENMAREGFLNHVDGDGLDLPARAELHGVRGWRALAENIAYNQGFDDPAAFAVERWMTSSKHRENILSGEFTHAGLGVSRAPDGRVYFTQVFMKR